LRSPVALVAALLLVSAVPGWAGGGVELAACDETVRARLDDWNGCACFYRLAREPALREPARRSLEGLAAERTELACPRFYLASMAFEDGADPSADFELAAGLYAAQRQPQGVFYARMSLGRWYRGRAEFDRALEQMELGAAAADQLGDPRLAIASKIEPLSLALSRGGDLVEIEDRLVELQQRTSDGRWPELALTVDDLLAQTRFRLGDLEPARAAFDALAERHRQSDNAYAEATARFNAALCLLQGFASEPVRQQALGSLHEALAVAERAGNLRIQVAALRKLGELDRGPDGRALIERSLVIARRLGEPEVAYSTLLAAAERVAGQRPQDARRRVAEADAMRSGSETASFLAEGWLHRLRIAWQGSEPAAALAESLPVLDEIERLRLGQSAARAEYFSLWLPAHQWLAGRLFALAAGHEEGADLLAGLAPAQREPVAFPDADPRWLEAAFAVGERMRARILRESGGEGGGDPVPVDQLRALLAPNEALLVYQLALWENFYGRFEGGSWLTVLDREGARLYALPDASHVAPALSHLEGLFRARDGGERGVVQVLERQLLGAALRELPEQVDHLIVIADGALYRLPLAALREDSGRALVERYRLSFAASAGWWAAKRQRRVDSEPSFARRALVIADPELRATRTQDELAPQAETAQGEGQRAPRHEQPFWQPLPEARREGRRVRRILGGDSRLRVGAEATEAEVRRLVAGRYAVLHFATHALVDERRLGRSGIVLAAGAGEDGLLENSEIAGLDLAGEVVVLAACRSGSGRVLYGEGPLSLARSFFLAGAGTVVASLWPLRDDDASVLFEPFYQHLARGESVAEALAGAQRELLAAGVPAEAWAGVVVLGDGAAVPFAGGLARRNRAARAALILGLLLALLLALVFWRLRRSRPGVASSR
jgi:CHAT domain-containing protein